MWFNPSPESLNRLIDRLNLRSSTPSTDGQAAGCRPQLGMPKAGGGRGPYVVLGLVSALAVGAIGFVHYDQQKQRQVRGNG